MDVSLCAIASTASFFVPGLALLFHSLYLASYAGVLSTSASNLWYCYGP